MQRAMPPPQLASGDRSRLAAPSARYFFRFRERFDLSRGKLPLIGGLVIGGIALVAATQFGAAELALASLTAYTVFRMLRTGSTLRQALIEDVELDPRAARS
jgi:hypothetical protein